MIPLTLWRDSNSLKLSVETLVGTSDLIGSFLESRSLIRTAQDSELAMRISESSAMPISRTQADFFTIAPLDILVTEVNGMPQFHIIELNGTGIGGLTNLPEAVLGRVLRSMGELPRQLKVPNPLVLIASSGKESESSPRLNKLIYEKLLFADAMADEFEKTHGTCHVRSLERLRKDDHLLSEDSPLVVVGYMKDFLNNLRCSVDGTISLFGRQVHAVVNDRFFANLLDRFDHQVDVSKIVVMNRTYLAGSDKGVVYQNMNDFLQEEPRLLFPNSVFYRFAHTRDELVCAVTEELANGRKIVIKPYGTGLGNGIEFFLDAKEPLDSVIKRCDHSLKETEEYYGLPGGALPYTLCEFLDAKTIQAPGHEMHGRKFELRVAVYRDGCQLKACPLIAKVSSMVYDPNAIDRMMLINNITSSVQKTKRHGNNFILPLSNAGTAELLGLQLDHLESLSQSCVAFVRYLLTKLEHNSDAFGLANFGLRKSAVAPMPEVVGAQVW